MEASNPTTTETNNPVETNKSSETNKPNKRRNYRHRKPRTNKPKKEKETKEEQEEEEEEEEICFICTEPIDYYALAPCGHRTCHMCTLRLRALYRTKNCAYCKIEATKVVFTNDGEKTYESYKRDDTPFYDKKHGIRFEKKEMQLDTERILQFQCPDDQCKESFSNHIEIKKHVKESHKKQLCDLCLRNKKIFSHEHTLYTSAQLHKHHREGDASFIKNDETGFTGHPECVFCKTRFYDSDELFKHCRNKHEQCHLCVRQGIQHQYYASYDSLEKHFEKEHYLCMYQECLNNKFVVFTTDIDLKAHEIDEHGASLSRQQRIRQARVDVDLNYSSSRDSSRRQPKQTKSNNKNVVSLSSEDFPDINGGPSSAQLMTQRMATLQVNKKDDWPSLGDERPLVAETNPPTESSSSSSSSQQAPAISRQAAAFDRIADLFKNVDKSIKFRQYTRQFEEGSISSKKWFELSDELCDKNDTLSEKIFEQTKDLLSSKAKIVELERVWNHKNNPTGSQSPQVLVINPKKPKPVRGTWDKVALAAQDAGGFAINKTPWSSNSRTSSESDLQSLFPALPTSDAHTSRRADISSMIKRNEERYTWGESSSSAANTDAEDNENRQRKKKKGKQVLFRVGL